MGKKVKTIRKKRAEIERNDGGLSNHEKNLIRKALRQVWAWSSNARKIVQKRCVGKDGFPRCELCKKRCPKIAVDHLKACGEIDEGYIGRLFVSSREMQGLCKKCHDAKTREERSLKRMGL